MVHNFKVGLFPFEDPNILRPAMREDTKLHAVSHRIYRPQFDFSGYAWLIVSCVDVPGHFLTGHHN
jgi:hypothetical protein